MWTPIREIEKRNSDWIEMNGRRAVLSTQLTYGTTLTTIYRDCRVKGRHFFTLKNDRRLSTPNNSKCYIPCLWNECGGQVSLLESRRSEHLKSVYASVNMDNYPSHGFVEVGEAAPHNGNYNLLKHRCESVDDMSKVRFGGREGQIKLTLLVCSQTKRCFRYTAIYFEIFVHYKVKCQP